MSVKKDPIRSCFSIGAAAAGGAGTESFVELWNAATSGVVAEIKRVVIISAEDGAGLVVKMKYHTAQPSPAPVPTPVPVPAPVPSTPVAPPTAAVPPSAPPTPAVAEPPSRRGRLPARAGGHAGLQLLRPVLDEVDLRYRRDGRAGFLPQAVELLAVGRRGVASARCAQRSNKMWSGTPEEPAVV